MPTRSCGCGCGQFTRTTRAEFIQGHHLTLAMGLAERANNGNLGALEELIRRNWLGYIERSYENVGRRSRSRSMATILTDAMNSVAGPDSRRWGVEIEFIGNWSSIQQEFRSRGLECRNDGYSHNVTTWWKLVSDTSVHGRSQNGEYGFQGGELVSPPLSGPEGFAELKLACEALAAAGTRVNRTCGLHVHHEALDFELDTFKLLIANYHACEGAIDKLVSASRRENHNTFCAGFNDIEIDGVRRATSISNLVYAIGTRYKKLNTQCFTRQGTVEFRQHQGSVNFNKISSWIRFGQAMIRAAREGRVMQATEVVVLFGFLDLGSEDRRFLERREERLMTREEARSANAERRRMEALAAVGAEEEELSPEVLFLPNDMEEGGYATTTAPPFAFSQRVN